VAMLIRDDREDAKRRTVPLVGPGLLYNGNIDAFVMKKKQENGTCYVSYRERESRKVWLS